LSIRSFELDKFVGELGSNESCRDRGEELQIETCVPLSCLRFSGFRIGDWIALIVKNRISVMNKIVGDLPDRRSSIGVKRFQRVAFEPGVGC
jgi:hypothetical protein